MWQLSFVEYRINMTVNRLIKLRKVFQSVRVQYQMAKMFLIAAIYKWTSEHFSKRVLKIQISRQLQT